MEFAKTIQYICRSGTRLALLIDPVMRSTEPRQRKHYSVSERHSVKRFYISVFLLVAGTMALLAVLLAAATIAFADDAVGTTKQWGTVDVTLKSYSVKGKTARIDLLLKNNSDKPENISSLMQFEILTDEGDKGEWNFNTRCDGMIPPDGLLKCKLLGDFESRPSNLVIQVGAGFDGDPVYFKVPVK